MQALSLVLADASVIQHHKIRGTVNTVRFTMANVIPSASAVMARERKIVLSVLIMLTVTPMVNAFETTIGQELTVLHSSTKPTVIQDAISLER